MSARRLGPLSAVVWLGLAISGLFAWLAVRDVNFGAVATALGSVRYTPFAPSLLALAVAVCLRGARWQALFDPASRPAFVPVLRATLVGLLFNSILPARAGELVAVVTLARETGNSRAEVLATVVAARAFDVFSLLVLLFATVPFLPEVSWLAPAAVLAGTLAAGILGTVVVLTVWGARPVLFALRPLAHLGLASAERAERIATNLVHGLASFRHASVAVTGFALTVASWFLLALSAWLLLDAFHLRVGFAAALLVVIATNLVLVLPGAPGAVGQVEAGAVVALSVFGIDHSRALSYGIVLHAVNVLPYLVLGYVALQRSSVAARRRKAAAASRLG